YFQFNESKIMSFKFATLVGCAIGDALGNPFETKLSSYQPLQDWDGTFKEGGTFWWGQPGQYTDDTLMSLGLANSLVRCKGFDPVDAAQEYLAWYNSKNTRGIGGTTARAMHNLKQGIPWTHSGITGDTIGGNGTAMRVSPLGIVYKNDIYKLLQYAIQDAQITHNAIEPKLGSMAVAIGTAMLASGKFSSIDVLEKLIEMLVDSIVKSKLLLVQEHLKKGSEHKDALLEIGSSGYVPETVGAAYYCLLANNNFKDTVIMAVKAGGDTDTTAAIAGAMAGTLYGIDV